MASTFVEELTLASYKLLRVDYSDVGKTSGHRTQIGPSFSIRVDTKSKQRCAVYECTCGRIQVVRVAKVEDGTQSRCMQCGLYTHGMTGSPEHSIWSHIIQRCTNKKNKAFKDYGGRGITVCREWRESFEAFYAYVGPRPSPAHELDRKENDGNYEPGNVRWTTPTVNCRNRRSNRTVTFQGGNMLLVELSEISGVSASTLHNRLKAGRTIDEAVSRSRLKRRVMLTAVLLLSVFVGCDAQQPPTQAVRRDPWPPGTVLVSRNRDEADNSSPGYWNHLCIYVGNYEIVESQMDRGVVLTSTKDYNARNYEWHPLFPRDLTVGQLAAIKAKTLVGLPYRAGSSLLPVDRNPEKGLNCVSVVRVGLVAGLSHTLPELRKPDDADNLTEVLTTQNPFGK